MKQFKIFTYLDYDEFKRLPQNRLKWVPKINGEISIDTVTIDPLHNFKVPTFLVVYDTAIT